MIKPPASFVSWVLCRKKKKEFSWLRIISWKYYNEELGLALDIVDVAKELLIVTIIEKGISVHSKNPIS